jgi:glycosyltransferase involved in cell wall biosynthesis
MKVLFDHPYPFWLAHGGFRTQIEHTKRGLEQIGVEVEFARWWDPDQKGDLVHFFSVAQTEYLRLANRQNLPVVMTPLLSSPCNRSHWQLALQGALVRTVRAVPFFRASKEQLRLTAYDASRHLIVGLEAERKVLVRVFGIDAQQISIAPLGLSNTYLQAGIGKRKGDNLICTGTIHSVKRTVLLANLAREAQVPVLFVGKPYHPTDPYWLKFKGLIDNKWVRYHPHVETEAEMISLLQAARGFVLYSEYENWCLSASEAAACGLPLLLPDQNWSRERFGSEARYFSPGNARDHVSVIQQFYQECPGLSVPRKSLFSWQEVARVLKAAYDRVLSSPQL